MEQDTILAELPDILTVKQFARALRVDPATVRRWIKAGIIPGIPLPHTGKRTIYRIKRVTLEEKLNHNSKKESTVGETSTAIPEEEK